MTKFKFLTKFKYAIGILSMTLFLIFAACVKEVVNNKSQFDTEKAELLKAKDEMTKSFKSMADAVRITGKKYFGVPHNSKQSFDKEAFLRDMTAEMSRQNPNVQTNPALRAKIWNPKTESLRDYMSANGASEKVITYSNNLKENLEAVGKKYSGKVDAGELDVKGMVASITEVFQNMENDVINDRTLTEPEKLALLASTTSGIELTPAWAEVIQNFYLNQINRAENWRWLRVLGNAIITVILVAVVASIIAVSIYTAVGVILTLSAIELILIGEAIAGSILFIDLLITCEGGMCIFPDDGCFCPI